MVKKSGRFSILFLILCLLGLSPGSGAGEEVDPRIEELRRHMERLVEENAAAMIAEQGSSRDTADVTMIIGTLFALGSMGERNLDLAVHYYRQASEIGSPEADFALANLYAVGLPELGQRFKRDPALALEFYEKAAMGGSVPAMVELGDVYSEGKNVDPDSKKALSYYMQAATRGDKTALERLEPVIRNAREWEAERPGRKANFPTSREAIVNPVLEKETQNRIAALDRLASKVYVELNKRVAASAKPKD